jgi:predicted nucleotide-binding protein
MAQISPKLLNRLAAKLGVEVRSVYPRIQQIANHRVLDRHLAALVLASENGIGIQQFSTPEERAQIRGALGRELMPGNGVSNLAPPTVIRKPSAKKPPKPPKAQDNSIFVVHGRNEVLTTAMFDFLRSLGLKPLEWEKAILLTKQTNPYVGDILDLAMAKVRAVLVLFTPDDRAMLDPSLLKSGDGSAEKKLTGQARANVLFEAGLALGRHPEKTILVEIGKLRKFSDIAGKHLVRLNGSFQTRNDLANRLALLGCNVDRTGSHWTKTGDFSV